MTEVENRFNYVRPNAEGIKRIEEVRKGCRELAGLIARVAPSCRETALAITKLEEVSTWANKAIAFNMRAEPIDNG